jgi:hypothetical protein
VDLAVGLAFALALGLICGAALPEVEPVERIGWSWAHVRRRISLTIVAGLWGVLLHALVTRQTVGLTEVLASGLAIGAIGTMFTGLTSAIVDQRAAPNEGIHRSARYALMVGLAIGVVGWLFGGLTGGLGLAV